MSDKLGVTNVTNVNSQCGFSALTLQRLLAFGTKEDLNDKMKQPEYPIIQAVSGDSI